MVYVWASLLVAVNSVWLFTTALALPGNWLMVVTTALFAWFQHDRGMFSIWTLVAITVLAIVGELLEFFAGAYGAKRAGGGRRAVVGAILGAISGAIVGTFAIPILLFGSVIGGCIGAAVGTVVMEHSAGKQAHESLKTGLSAGLGHFLGINLKLIIGLAIWLTVVIAAFI